MDGTLYAPCIVSCMRARMDSCPHDQLTVLPYTMLTKNTFSRAHAARCGSVLTWTAASAFRCAYRLPCVLRMPLPPQSAPMLVLWSGSRTPLLIRILC
jgi:hypothetical protein